MQNPSACCLLFCLSFNMAVTTVGLAHSVQGTILIVDDEPAIREMLDFTLSNEGYSCRTAADASEARELLAVQTPDLILLDWMLPGVSGIDLARGLKRDPKTSDIPIVMVTARDGELEKVKGLDTGADDYITKPFSNKELLARIRAVMRRTSKLLPEGAIEIGGLKLDSETYRVSAAEIRVELSPTEFRLLHFFVTHPERVYTRGQLLDSVWGDNIYIDERTVDVHIRRLRKALIPHNYDRYIQTVRSVGYRFSTN